jgi:MFS-type transporter involved in bile tolerance (Atg22 family)
MIIEVILYLVILGTSFPTGLLLAKLCEDELVKDRKYFIIMVYIIGLVLLGLIWAYPRISFILALVYMLLVMAIIISKSGKSSKKH